jgi:hypothetical protein
LPILVTPLGIVTLVRSLILANAPLPMPDTFFSASSDGIVRALSLPRYPVISTVSSLSSLYI